MADTEIIRRIILAREEDTNHYNNVGYVHIILAASCPRGNS